MVLVFLNMMLVKAFVLFLSHASSLHALHFIKEAVIDELLCWFI